MVNNCHNIIVPFSFIKLLIFEIQIKSFTNCTVENRKYKSATQQKMIRNINAENIIITLTKNNPPDRNRGEQLKTQA